MFKIQKANRKRSYLKILLAGAAGSGKTYSALQLADGLVGLDNTIVIDTENGSASLYSHLGGFRVIEFNANIQGGYSPKNYIIAITEAMKHQPKCIIIDSITQEWSGAGGCLEIHERLGGRFNDWAKVTPQHRAFIDCIMQSPCHFILTSRKKTDWSFDPTNKDSAKKIEKVGLKNEQREGIDYEVSIELTLDQSHNAIATKDRTGIFADRNPWRIIPETGKEIAKWNEGGIAPPVEKVKEAFDGEAVPPTPPPQPQPSDAEKQLADRYKAITDSIRSAGLTADKKITLRELAKEYKKYLPTDQQKTAEILQMMQIELDKVTGKNQQQQPPKSENEELPF